MIEAKVTVRDSGMDEFVERMKKLRGNVDIGVFGEQDSEQVVIAATNEFGTNRAGKGHNITIPERSFLRSTADEQAENVREQVDKVKVAVITGQVDKNKFLKRLGLWFEGLVKAKIQAGGEPFIENAESTKAAKIARGREWPQPLNDTGRLRQSIISKVNE